MKWNLKHSGKWKNCSISAIFIFLTMFILFVGSLFVIKMASTNQRLQAHTNVVCTKSRLDTKNLHQMTGKTMDNLNKQKYDFVITLRNIAHYDSYEQLLFLPKCVYKWESVSINFICEGLFWGPLALTQMQTHFDIIAKDYLKTLW